MTQQFLNDFPVLAVGVQDGAERMAQVAIDSAGGAVLTVSYINETCPQALMNLMLNSLLNYLNRQLRTR